MIKNYIKTHKKIVILVSVTVVLVLAIITTLLCIRHSDKSLSEAETTTYNDVYYLDDEQNDKEEDKLVQGRGETLSNKDIKEYVKKHKNVYYGEIQ